LVRGIGAVGLLACLAPFAQAQKGFEIGGDASLTHYAYSHSVGPSTNTTSLAAPISNIRLAFPTEGAFEPEIAAGLLYSTTSGRSSSTFTGDVGLLMELSQELDGGWFVRPAIGWQRILSTGTTSRSRATLGGGIGARVGLTDRISTRIEARYTYLTESAGESANAVGVLLGISVFTRGR
jgi:hypothetical protein